MKKIRLDLDALKVESFVTSDLGSRSEGTVFAMANTLCELTCKEWHGPTCFGGGICHETEGFDCDWTAGGVSCTFGPDPTDVGCTLECETEEDCTEALTDCDGGGTH